MEMESKITYNTQEGKNMNIYVGQYKDIVKNYYKKQREFNRLLAENNKRFSAE